MLVGVCRPLVGSLADAEDCAAEALAALIEPGIPAHVRDERAWLITIAKRRAVDLLRQRERQGRRQDRLVQCTQHRVMADVAQSVTSEAGAEWLLRQAKHQLPATSYAVVQAMANGQDAEEAAEQLGLTRRSVESHLHRARKVLRPLATSALVAISWLVAGVRRRAPAAGSLAAAAIAVTAVLLPAVDPVPDRESDPALRYSEASDEPLPRRTTTMTPSKPRPPGPVGRSQESRTVAVAPPSSPAGTPAETSKTLAEVQPLPDQRSVKIVEEDRGGPSDPVGGTLKCVSEVEVSLEHIGC